MFYRSLTLILVALLICGLFFVQVIEFNPTRTRVENQGESKCFYANTGLGYLSCWFVV